MEVFGIATTAFVLGVSPITQRRWEALGLLPRTPLRLLYPTVEHGRRLYDAAMIEALADAVERHDVGAGRLPGRSFFDEVENDWLAAYAALGVATVLTVEPAAA